MCARRPSGGAALEAFRGVAAPDDFEAPLTLAFHRAGQFVTGVGAIGKDMAQPQKGGAYVGEEAGLPQRRLPELLPWNWSPASEQSQAA